VDEDQPGGAVAGSAPPGWSVFDSEPQVASNPAASWQAAFIEQQVSQCVLARLPLSL
jgi:hypothetical protein